MQLLHKKKYSLDKRKEESLKIVSTNDKQLYCMISQQVASNRFIDYR